MFVTEVWRIQTNKLLIKSIIQFQSLILENTVEFRDASYYIPVFVCVISLLCCSLTVLMYTCVYFGFMFYIDAGL